MKKKIGENELNLNLLLLLKKEFPNLIQSNENEFTFNTKYKNLRKELKVGEKYNSKPNLFNYPLYVEDYLTFSEELQEYHTFIKRVEDLVK